jgi:predicted DNA-binding protein (MmcQ/YjbR family)
MINEEKIREIAMALPEVNEAPHFEKTSFRIGKKIFVTLNLQENRFCVKLSEIDQDVFSAFDRSVIFPVPNKWGKQGWTLVDMGKVREDMTVDILKSAYCAVAPKKLADQVSGIDNF